MRTCLFLTLVIAMCLSACLPGNNQPAGNSHPVAAFSITGGAMVKDKNGVKKKLSDILRADTTFVIRLTDNYPPESKHIALYRIRWFTDNYPPTDSIIVLADKLPADTGWGAFLKNLSLKVRIFQIDSSLLPPTLENQHRAYLFYLNKQLQAGNIYVPDSLEGIKTNTYFGQIAALMGREQKNPLLDHTKGKNRYWGNNGTNTDLYLGNRRVRVGDRSVNTTYYEDFYFRNTGREPLVIYNVTNNWSRSECRVYVPERPVRPGEMDRIRVYYRPWLTGSFRNEIRIYSNTPGSPHTLAISGTAINAVRGRTVIGTSRFRRF